MKIAILANSDIGLYKFRKELIQELINQGNEVYISLPNGVFIQPLTDLGCIFIETDVDRRGVNPFTDFKLIIRYLRLIAKLKPDLVITYDLDKKNVINYYGFQMDVKPFIRKAHCFVLPSYHEGMANTLLEAGAMGRPLITSNIYGCKDAVLDGETGYLVNSQDCQDLYAKISDFILLPFEQKRMMGYKSCEYVRSKFDKRTVVTKTINRLKRE